MHFPGRNIGTCKHKNNRRGHHVDLHMTVQNHPITAHSDSAVNKMEREHNILVSGLSCSSPAVTGEGRDLVEQHLTRGT